ncbi:hypothetical protein L3Q72_05810 [Vibrio sp. JC009]|uniref:hypothetical protein n=1 Tax=Vibrio sp. JC009 TaxID=2912314 RepID=UPI0023B1A1B0|nr:hypothetical protein [Vibrio sp. JC009]WED22909.1 hypothetical protein L3Q72_05810 [Vibrio sp. JC009]
MKKITVLLAACLSLLSLQAFTSENSQGEGPQGGNPPSFSDMDTNGDGLLQKDELRGPLADEFDRFDQDGDGALSEEELPPPPPQRQ